MAGAKAGEGKARRRTDRVRLGHGAFEAAATSDWMVEKLSFGHHLPAQHQAIADTAPCTGLTPFGTGRKERRRVLR